MKHPALEQIDACLYGLALGDAIGAPVETQTASQCADYVRDRVAHLDFEGVYRRQPGYPEFAFGQVTDDTQLTLLTAETRLSPDYGFADSAAEYSRTKGFVGGGKSTEKALDRYYRGATLDECGEPAPRAGNGAAIRVAPLAIRHWRTEDSFGRPASGVLVDAVVRNACVTHRAPLAVAAAVAMAEGIRRALHKTSPTTPEFWEVVATAVRCGDPHGRIHNYDLATREFAERIRSYHGKLDLPREEALAEIQEWTPKPARWHEGVSSWAPASVLWTLRCFARNKDCFLDAVADAILGGGDTDSTAAMTGALTGAYTGILGDAYHLIPRLNDRGEPLKNEISRVCETLYWFHVAT